MKDSYCIVTWFFLLFGGHFISHSALLNVKYNPVRSRVKKSARPQQGLSIAVREKRDCVWSLWSISTRFNWAFQCWCQFNPAQRQRERGRRRGKPQENRQRERKGVLELFILTVLVLLLVFCWKEILNFLLSHVEFINFSSFHSDWHGISYQIF